MASTDEKPLKGGYTTPVSKLGNQVLREAGPWTPTVQRLLQHLRDAGIEWCPEPQGRAKDGREMVSYVKGKTYPYPLPEWMYDEAILKQAAAWLREFHDASVGFDSEDSVWRAPRHQPAEVICHNEFAPSNFVFKDHEFTGVIDWDFASPGPRLWDLSYLAYRLVPLMGPDNPDAPTASFDLMGRLRLLRDTYGSDASTGEILTVLVARLDDMAQLTGTQAKQQKNDKLRDVAARYAADADFLRQLIK